MVPFPCEARLSSIGDTVHPVVWYRRSGGASRDGRHLLLRGAVYEATVWLNGRELGSHLVYLLRCERRNRDGENPLGCYRCHSWTSRVATALEEIPTGICFERDQHLADHLVGPVPGTFIRRLRRRHTCGGTLDVEAQVDGDGGALARGCGPGCGAGVAHERGEAAPSGLRIPEPRPWSPSATPLRSVALPDGEQVLDRVIRTLAYAVWPAGRIAQRHSISAWCWTRILARGAAAAMKPARTACGSPLWL